MSRYEVAIDTQVAFAGPGPTAFASSEQVSILFNDRVFVWHDLRSAHAFAPVLTTVITNGDDYSVECLSANRLLSALSFELDSAFAVLTTSATGFKGPLDPPLLAQPAIAATRVIVDPVTRLDVVDDPQLRKVLGLFREGRAATSPFYRVLAFFNSLDATFDGRESERKEALDTYVTEQMRLSGDAPTEGWGPHVRDTFRNAIAHAVRPPGRPLLDPDDLGDWHSYDNVAKALRTLVRQRVKERWQRGVSVARS